MNVAEASTTLVWGAATAYAIALVCFTMLLARAADRAVVEAPATVGAKVGGPTTTADARTDVLEPAPRRSKAEGIARATVLAGLVLHVGAVVTRGIAAGRAPWANLYEFMLVGGLVAVVVLLVVQREKVIPFLGTAVVGIVVLFLAVAQVNFFVPADGVQPALQSYWLVIHVGVAVTATGVFTVGCVAAVLQLLRSARATASTRLAGRRSAWLDTAPAPVALESLSFRLNAVGFELWTFTLIAGAIWAEHAWGRYWGWDPKEVWTFVIWVLYAAYLHARTTQGWSGRKAAWLAVSAYVAVIMNFTIVNTLFQGLHSYAEVS